MAVTLKALSWGECDAGDCNAGDKDAGCNDAGDQDADENDAGDQDADDNDAGDQDADDKDAGDQDAGDYDAVLGGSCMLTQSRVIQGMYVVGRSTGDNPEEEKRQKSFQGILNKITPDNFERLTNKVRPGAFQQQAASCCAVHLPASKSCSSLPGSAG
eukprot:1018373-Pelagomonas_calceolata.AAC.7